MRLLASVAIVLAMALPCASAQDAAIPSFTQADIPAWRDFIRPSAEEAGYEAIDWLTTFEDGVRQADALGKPLLLWVMNGHPLGCT